MGMDDVPMLDIRDTQFGSVQEQREAAEEKNRFDSDPTDRAYARFGTVAGAEQREAAEMGRGSDDVPMLDDFESAQKAEMGVGRMMCRCWMTLRDGRGSDDVPMLDDFESAQKAEDGRGSDDVPMLDDFESAQKAEMGETFTPYSKFRNVRLSWNRGVLTQMLTEEQSEWAARLRTTGLRPPYALGCILRFLLK
ncbi:unnamed protein product [Closterium sp. NIES-64]|nr:unnamed protein product [Closterium sp. NIES-64]